MIDNLENFGRDDGFKCEKCGGKTYLTYQDGRGLDSYACEDCDEHFQVEYDLDDDDADYSEYEM